MLAVGVAPKQDPPYTTILYPKSDPGAIFPYSRNGTGKMVDFGTDVFGLRFASFVAPMNAFLVPVSRGPMKVALAAQGIVDKNDFSEPNFPNGGTWTINWDIFVPGWFSISTYQAWVNLDPLGGPVESAGGCDMVMRFVPYGITPDTSFIQVVSSNNVYTVNNNGGVPFASDPTNTIWSWIDDAKNPPDNPLYYPRPQLGFFDDPYMGMSPVVISQPFVRFDTALAWIPAPKTLNISMYGVHWGYLLMYGP